MASGAAIQVQNFVGREVNGFEIIKLIGKITLYWGREYNETI